MDKENKIILYDVVYYLMNCDDCPELELISKIAEEKWERLNGYN